MHPDFTRKTSWNTQKVHSIFPDPSQIRKWYCNEADFDSFRTHHHLLGNRCCVILRPTKTADFKFPEQTMIFPRPISWKNFLPKVFLGRPNQPRLSTPRRVRHSRRIVVLFESPACKSTFFQFSSAPDIIRVPSREGRRSDEQGICDNFITQFGQNKMLHLPPGQNGAH